LYAQYISDDEVTHYFSAADVCVLPYKSATQSGITAIAHHFELPIIATDVGGLKEKIKDGSTGLIVDQPEKEAFASAVKRFFKECNTESMRNIIRNDNAQNTWEQFGEKIIDFARDL
jgi:glycosyltransferase involved in cell wall biosynthesis